MRKFSARSCPSRVQGSNCGTKRLSRARYLMSHYYAAGWRTTCCYKRESGRPGSLSGEATKSDREPCRSLFLGPTFHFVLLADVDHDFGSLILVAAVTFGPVSEQDLSKRFCSCFGERKRTSRKTRRLSEQRVSQ